MNKARQNFIIDVLMFILIMGLAGIGFLLEYVLVPGREVPEKYGFNAVLYLFGLQREGWGEIHLILAYILLVLLALHIILHWKAICVIFRNLITRSELRKVLTPVFVTVNLIFLTFFLYSEPEFREFQSDSGRGRYTASLIKTGPAAGHKTVTEKTAEIQETENIEGMREIAVKAGHENGGPRRSADQQPAGINQETGQKSARTRLDMVRGMYTLGTVAGVYDVPVNYLKQKLGLPESTSSREKLGQLRKRYSFRMDDVERVIMEYRGGQE